MEKKRVLFLCTGNSCRSQLAEALVNFELADSWEAFSAGTQPVGYVHPLVLTVLEEIGIHHEGRSKSTDVFRNERFNLVITVCDDAAENCPVWLAPGKKAHIGFTDPAHTVGSQAEILAAFRSMRDRMRESIIGYLKSYRAED